jgi:hypothetical protein
MLDTDQCFGFRSPPSVIKPKDNSDKTFHPFILVIFNDTPFPNPLNACRILGYSLVRLNHDKKNNPQLLNELMTGQNRTGEVTPSQTCQMNYRYFYCQVIGVSVGPTFRMNVWFLSFLSRRCCSLACSSASSSDISSSACCRLPPPLLTYNHTINKS